MIRPSPYSILGRNFLRSLAFFILGVIATLWFSSSCNRIPLPNFGSLFPKDTTFQDTVTHTFWDTTLFQDTTIHTQFGGFFYDTLFGGYWYDTIPYTEIPNPLDSAKTLRQYTVDITDQTIEGEVIVISASDVYDIKLTYTPLVPKIIQKTVLQTVEYEPLHWSLWGAIEIGPYVGVGADVVSKDNRYRIGYRYYYNTDGPGFHGISAGIKIFEL